METLLSHYFQPQNPIEVVEAGLEDWVDVLSPFSQEVIDRACKAYVRDQPRRRPTPGDIRSKCNGAATSPARGNRANLSYDELAKLNEVLATARKWLGIPGLRDHGESILRYWGEPV